LVHISGNCGNIGRPQNSDIFVTEKERKMEGLKETIEGTT
jgi:hypothetical protein